MSVAIDSPEPRVERTEHEFRARPRGKELRGQRRMAKSFDLVNATKRYKGELHEFFLDFSGWRKFKSKHRLDWQKLQFTRANKRIVPPVRGIYAFTIELTPSKLPTHGYILYIGLAGDASASNLKVRYGQYLQDQEKDKGRPKVLFMLKNWAGDLQFNFVPLPDTKVDLAKLESGLLNAIRPPINILDFSSQITAVRKAAF